MQEILKFNMDNQEYSLIKNDNKFIFKPDNITIKEKQIILEVFSQIIPSNDIINFGSLTLDDRKILHLMDKKNGFHLFYQNCNNVLSFLEKEEQAQLNYLFNNQNEYVATGIKKEQNNFFKRVVKVGGRIITVLVSTALAFSLL